MRSRLLRGDTKTASPVLFIISHGCSNILEELGSLE
jgi:hypothetical protein